MTPSQLKAARALAGITIEELATQAKVGATGIATFETGKSNLSAVNQSKIINHFKSIGTEFISGGVREVTHATEVLEGSDAYARLLDDIYAKTDKGDQLLFICANNAVTSPECLQREVALRAKGVKFRFLIKEGDTYLTYPLEEYRYLPEEDFLNAPIIVFGDYAASIKETADHITVTWSPHSAKVYTCLFNTIWKIAEMPTETTAETRYV